jgi:cytochrome P450
MTKTALEAQAYPIAPDVPMNLISRLRALRVYNTGPGLVRDAGGPVTMLKLGPRRLIPPFAVITSPQGARDVLGVADGAYDKENLVHVESRDWGNNVFNLPNESWLKRRRALQPLFTKKHVASFAGHMADAADAVTNSWITEQTVDLNQQCRALTLRVVGWSIFGVDLGDRAKELGPPIEHALRWVTRRSTRPVRSPGWLPTPARHRFRSSLGIIRAVIDEAINDARDHPELNAELIRLLLKTTDPATGELLTDQAIRDELFAFLVAGHDTTSTTLSYCLWAIGRDSAMQERVATEVAALGDRQLTVGDVPDLPYTVQVIHEALRICPPGPAITRLAMRDVVVDGYRIPTGTNVLIGVYALHHDPALWTDPEIFDPDRFAPGRSDERDRWQFLPFGAGQRNCIGNHFAMLEATLGLATIIRRVEITSTDSTFPLALPFTMTAGGPVLATIRARTPATT